MQDLQQTAVAAGYDDVSIHQYKQDQIDKDVIQFMSDDFLKVAEDGYIKNLSIRSVLGEISLSNIENIQKLQLGYSIDARDKVTKLDNWPENCLVIGDNSSDPIIIKRGESKIYFSKHGTGNWNVLEVAESIIDFALFLKIWIQTYEIDYKLSIYDDDFNMKSQFIESLQNKIKKSSTNVKIPEIFIFLGIDGHLSK